MRGGGHRAPGHDRRDRPCADESDRASDRGENADQCPPNREAIGITLGLPGLTRRRYRGQCCFLSTGDGNTAAFGGFHPPGGRFMTREINLTDLSHDPLNCGNYRSTPTFRRRLVA
jgi:hypothetical protein